MWFDVPPGSDNSPDKALGNPTHLLLLLSLCSALFTHCALHPLPRDLAVYMNRDIFHIVSLEKLVLKRYNEQTGTNYNSDEALRQSLHTEIIPVYAHFIDLARKIKPRTEPVQKLHAIYRMAATMRLRGFKMVLLAIDTQDPDLVHQANRLLEQGQQFAARWQGRLEAMSGHYGLKNI